MCVGGGGENSLWINCPEVYHYDTGLLGRLMFGEAEGLFFLTRIIVAYYVFLEYDPGLSFGDGEFFS